MFIELESNMYLTFGFVPLVQTQESSLKRQWCVFPERYSSSKIIMYRAYIYIYMEIFIIKEGIYWWGKSLSLVGNLERLVGKIPTSLLVKNALQHRINLNIIKAR